MKKQLSLLWRGRIFLLSFLAALCGSVNAQEIVTDVLTKDDFVATNSSYKDFVGVISLSGVVYAGNSATTYGAIQLRSDNNNSGIVTTKTTGKVKSIKVTWNTNTSAARQLEVYAQQAPYTSAANLYGDTKGTLIKTFAFSDKANDNSENFIVVGEYPYIGFRSKSGALYLDKIEIEWEIDHTIVNVAVPVLTSTEGDSFTESTVITATAEEGATIRYTDNEDVPTVESKIFPPEGLTITKTTTIKAIAVKDGISSAVVEKTYEKINIPSTIGDGTRENPYTVADVIALNNLKNTPAWVKGVIVGYANSYSENGFIFNVDGSNVPNTNLLLADKVDEINYKACIPVQLSSGDVRNKLNLKDNQGNLGRELMIYGSLESYFSTAGIKNPTDYILQEYTEPTLNVVSSVDFGAVKIDKTAEMTVTITGYNITEDLQVQISGKGFSCETTTIAKEDASSYDLKVVFAPTASGEYTGILTILGGGLAEPVTVSLSGSGSEIVMAEVLRAVVFEYNNEYFALTTDYSSNVFTPQSVDYVAGKVIVDKEPDAKLSWYIDEVNRTIKSTEGKYVVMSGNNAQYNEKEYKWNYSEANKCWATEGGRTLLYRDGYNIRSYSTQNIKASGYSDVMQFATFADGYVRKVGASEDAPKYGTICLPYAVAEGDFSGAEFCSVLGKITTGGEVTALALSEPVKELEAGQPYIFYATADKVVLAYSGEETATAATANGLIGSFVGMDVPEDKHVISGNKVQLCGSGSSIAEHRAYIDFDQMTEFQPVQGVNARLLTFDGVTTSVGNIQAEAGRTADVYTLSGVLVRKQAALQQATEGLPKGVYIVGGKKMIVE